MYDTDREESAAQQNNQTPPQSARGSYFEIEDRTQLSKLKNQN